MSLLSSFSYNRNGPLSPKGGPRQVLGAVRLRNVCGQPLVDTSRVRRPSRTHLSRCKWQMPVASYLVPSYLVPTTTGHTNRVTPCPEMEDQWRTSLYLQNKWGKENVQGVPFRAIEPLWTLSFIQNVARLHCFNLDGTLSC